MILILLGVLLVLIYWCNYRLNYWNRKKVPSVPTSVYSSIASLFYFRTPLVDHYANVHKQLEHHFGGSFWLFQPQLVVRDPELIKQILVKDFEYFRDRGNVIFDKYDPLTHHIFNSPGELWRAQRVRLTPTFTSGKMKFMFGIVKECAEECQEMLENSAAQGIILDFKNVSTDYTTDVINSAAFGWKSNAINDANCEFKKVTRGLANRNLRIQTKRILHTLFPFLEDFLNFYVLQTWIRNFFFDTVREAVEHRKKTGYQRSDFLQLLISLNQQVVEKNGAKSAASSNSADEFKIWTPEQMTSQCLLFFIAGYDTSSLVLSMTLLELAINLDIQKTLHEEIDTFASQNENKITYEMLKSMPYLEKVVKETLRKYPVLPVISRICVKPYNIPNTDIIIEKGTEVLISLAGLHKDPAIYPNPEVFDPERFSDEEIQKRHKYAYVPFGEGPRNCIGSRFGLMTVKLGIVHILQKFNLEKTPQTVYPMTFQPTKFVTDCGAPLFLRCVPRN